LICADCYGVGGFEECKHLNKNMLQGENENTEFKSGFNDEVIETITAFANTKGGKVLIGVTNKGIPVKHFTIGHESMQNWINEIKNKTQPSIIPDVDIVKFKGVDVVEISCQEFPVKPVACKGRYFKRVKNSNHQLSPTEIADLNLSSLQLSWDSYPAHGFAIEDLDLTKIEKFIAKVNAVGRFRLEGTAFECLEKLRLINKSAVTNAAVLLFSKNDSIYNVHLGRFKTPSMIIDDKMLRLTLFDAVEDIQKYLLSQMKVAFEITGITTQRTEILEYPLPAIRELILNCLIHRDYLSPVDVQIRMFDTSISFFNPGTLFGNLTIESLKTNTYQAYARNKLIAEAFYLTGDIEKYGSGFRRIRNEIDNYPTMDFVCEEIPNGFLATLNYVQQKISTKPFEIKDNFLNSKNNVTENVTENRTERILKIIGENNKITTAEIAKIIGVTRMTISRDIEFLKENGLLQRIGPAKGGFWKVK